MGDEARRDRNQNVVLTEGVSKQMYLVMNITAWEYTGKHAGMCM